jgi:hypothetical protein
MGAARLPAVQPSDVLPHRFPRRRRGSPAIGNERGTEPREAHADAIRRRRLGASGTAPPDRSLVEQNPKKASQKGGQSGHDAMAAIHRSPMGWRAARRPARCRHAPQGRGNAFGNRFVVPPIDVSVEPRTATRARDFARMVDPDVSMGRTTTDCSARPAFMPQQPPRFDQNLRICRILCEGPGRLPH